MLKNINVSTKITLLILAIAIVSVTAVSFFSYDYHVKSAREKHLTNLNALADNYANYLNTYFNKGAIAVQLIQQSEILKKPGQGAAAPAADDFLAAAMPADDNGDASMESVTDAGNPINDYLIKQKSILGIDEIILTSATGSVIGSSDP